MGSTVTDQDFVALWEQYRSVTKVARHLQWSVRHTNTRRRDVEARLNIRLIPNLEPAGAAIQVKLPEQGIRVTFNNFTGTIIAFADAHFWPGDRSRSFEALLILCQRLKPSLIVCAGDIFDGATVSRHPPSGWHNPPSVEQELTYCQEMMAEVEEVCQGIPRVWTLGNHDERFAKRLARVAPEYVRVHGMAIEDHFPAWQFGYSLMINDGEPGRQIMFKHMFRGGVHSAYTNLMNAGITIVTGHEHRGDIRTRKDYNPRRWGVVLPCISQFGPQYEKFGYSQDAPFDWTEGFGVLTVDKELGLLPPELCTIQNGKALFRNEVIA
jgi:predicted MPP superfamily phosphohydrolase